MIEYMWSRAMALPKSDKIRRLRWFIAINRSAAAAAAASFIASFLTKWAMPLIILCLVVMMFTGWMVELYELQLERDDETEGTTDAG